MLNVLYFLSPHLLVVAALVAVWAAYLRRRGVREGPLWLLGPVIAIAAVAALGVRYRLDAEGMYFCINSGPLPTRQAASVGYQQLFHAHGLGLAAVLAAVSGVIARGRARAGLVLLALGAGLAAGAAGLEHWLWAGLWDGGEAALLERATVLPQVYALAVSGGLAWGAGLLVLWRDRSPLLQRRWWTRVLVLLAVVASAGSARALLYASTPAGGAIPAELRTRGLPALGDEVGEAPIDFFLTDTSVSDPSHYVVVYQGHAAGSSAMHLRPASEEESPGDGGVYVIDPRYRALDRRFSLLMVKAVTFDNVWDSAAYLREMGEVKHVCYGCGPDGGEVTYEGVVEVASGEEGFFVDDQRFSGSRAVSAHLAQRAVPRSALLLHPEGMTVEDVALLCGTRGASHCAVAWD